MRNYLGIMMSPPQESDEWSFQNFSTGFKKIMMTHPQFNDIGNGGEVIVYQVSIIFNRIILIPIF